jgi:DNA polymerase V
MRPQQAQQLMGIHGRHMVAELNGLSCFPLEREGKVRKSIARTRTFGEETNNFNVLEAAIASFATQAAYRLRESGQVTKKAALFLASNKHKPGYRRWGQEVIYQVPTADTGHIISSLITALKEIYNPNAKYYRAGVLLYDFTPEQWIQPDLMGEVNVLSLERAKTRMETIDNINARWGKRKIRYAAEDLGNKWKPRYNLRSPRYVSRWDELPQVTIR